MYICNRCGCTAMVEMGKKLNCLNCGNEQAKALSRQRATCASNPAGHNATTVQKLDPATPRPKTAPQPAAPSAQKRIRKITSVISVIALLISLLATVVPLLYNLFTTTDVSYAVVEEEASLADETDEWEFFSNATEFWADDDFFWYYISSDGMMFFDESAYFEAENAALDLILPAEIAGQTITGIAFDAFYLCDTIETVFLPDTVTAIDAYAFDGCSALREIYLPAGIQRINYDAVWDCPALTAIYYPGTAEDWEQVEVHPENEELLEHLVFLG